MSNKLTVGVLFRNNAKLVIPFFYCLRKSTIMDLTIIAIDQASTDNTNDELQKICVKGKDIIIRPETNLGIAGGRNLILRELKKLHQGGYEKLLLMDSDVLVTLNESLNRMVDRLWTNSEVGVVYAKIQSFWDAEDISSGICFCLIRKEVIEQVGEFDEGFKMFWDDTDYMYRMRMNGWVSCIDQKALGVHFWGETTKRGTEKGEIRKIAIQHDKEYYEKKHDILLPELPPGWK